MERVRIANTYLIQFIKIIIEVFIDPDALKKKSTLVGLQMQFVLVTNLKK